MTQKKPKPRTGETTWKKGQSGNPGGRSPRVGPNGETIAELARVHTAEALATLVEVCNAKQNEPRDRVSAANAILDRGWGKPKESVDLDAKVEGSGVPVIQIVRYAADSPD
ncbi:MAG: DUF5681 domain-containing protein [Steroidobacteraceae bacterium]|nr:DUF5681 domain-containing protein [Steroidobacteraceae bacterium]